MASHFGSLSRAIEEAGLVPRAPGSQHDDRSAERADNRRRVAHALADARHGAEELAAAIVRLAAARREGDAVTMHAALIDVSAAALGWAGNLGAAE